MANITNMVAAFIIFAAMITLSINIYDGFKYDATTGKGYNFTEGDILTLEINNGTNNITRTGNIIAQLNNLTFREGIEQITVGIQELTPGNQQGIDLWGAIQGVGIGAFKTVTGLLIFPYQIAYIITSFYAGAVPGMISGVLLQLITVFIGFKLLAAYFRRESL